MKREELIDKMADLLDDWKYSDKLSNCLDKADFMKLAEEILNLMPFGEVKEEGERVKREVMALHDKFVTDLKRIMGGRYE